MQLFIASINSGSNGNCYYVGNHEEAILVDAGISCRETETRMQRLGLSMSKVKAIFITHEHSDHIRGVEVLARKHQLPVYITQKTLRYSRLQIEAHLVENLKAYEPVTIGNLTVTGFPKNHDASDPHSFLVTGNGVKVGVFTDIGSSCDHLEHHFKQCHAAFLEANYCEDMLENGYYPLHLKRRIRGKNGHLSNKQALDLFLAHKPAYMSHVLLSHLSKENNRPELAQSLFAEQAGETRVIVASRYHESEVYTITATGEVPEFELLPTPKVKVKPKAAAKPKKKPAANQLAFEF